MDVQEDTFLYNATGEPIGVGTRASAPLWDGEKVVGLLVTDDLITQEPITPQQSELLALFASAVGHLYTRKKAAEDLATSEASERRLRHKLQALQTLSIKIGRAPDLRSLCLQAVESGRTELGFDRLGIWLAVEDNPNIFTGTYGTDEHGNTRDEWQQKSNLADKPSRKCLISGQRPYIFEQSDVVFDDRQNVVGTADHCMVPLWDGKRIFGYITTDNLLTQKPMTKEYIELLRLYASSIGFLYSRKTVETELAEREADEQAFRKQLQALHDVNIELSRPQSATDICRHAVQLSVNKLGFERVGVWLTTADKPESFTGTYGTDLEGNLRDERYIRLSMQTEREMVNVLSGQKPFGLRDYKVPSAGNAKDVRTGQQVLVPFYDGRKNIGVVCMDNLIHNSPITDHKIELLKLFAADLAYLYSRKLAEDALRASEEEHRLLIESQSDVVVKVDNEDCLLFASSSFYRTFDLMPTDVIGSKLRLQIHPDDQEQTDKSRAALRKSAKTVYYANRIKTKQGWRWFSWAANPMLEDGKLTAIVAVGRDITVQKEHEELQRISEAAIESSATGVAMADLEGNITFVNKAFLKAWGYQDQGEVIGKPSLSFWQDTPGADAVIESLQTTPSVSGDLVAKRKDGSLFDVHFISTMVTDDAGKPICMMGWFLDVTERRQLEKDVLEASIMERRAIGQDLHDSLGQTLTGIAFLSKALEDNLSRKSLPEASDAAKIAKHIDRSIYLTRSLARGCQPIQLESGGLAQALQELADTASEMYGISCTLHCPTHIPSGSTARATHVYYIVREAVTNAARHGRAKNVTITMEPTGNGMIKLAIVDDGIGLTPQPSKQGLGIRSMRYRAETLGGELKVESLPRQGTTVSCTFATGSIHTPRGQKYDR